MRYITRSTEHGDIKHGDIKHGDIEHEDTEHDESNRGHTSVKGRHFWFLENKKKPRVVVVVVLGCIALCERLVK